MKYQNFIGICFIELLETIIFSQNSSSKGYCKMFNIIIFKIMNIELSLANYECYRGISIIIMSPKLIMIIKCLLQPTASVFSETNV